MRTLNILSILCLLLNFSQPALASTDGEAEDAGGASTSTPASGVLASHASATSADSATSAALEDALTSTKRMGAEVGELLEKLSGRSRTHIDGFKASGDLQLVEEMTHNLAVHAKCTEIYTSTNSMTLKAYQKADEALKANDTRLYGDIIDSLELAQQFYTEINERIQVPLIALLEYEALRAEILAARADGANAE